MNDLEFGKLTKFCFPGFGQKQGFFRNDSSLLLLNFSLQMSKIQDTNWDGPIWDKTRAQSLRPGRLDIFVSLSVIFSALKFEKSFWLSLTHSVTGIWHTWQVLNVLLVSTMTTSVVCLQPNGPNRRNKPKIRWRITWRPFFCTNTFRIISRFNAIQLRYQYGGITQDKCRKPYNKTNLNSF